MSKPSENLPVELWLMILKYSISVPCFFDSTTPVETEGIDGYNTAFNDEGPYWEAERVRNRLRQVCWSWDDYLRNFDHRYVRLRDVELGNVPLSAVKQAIRIDAALYKKINAQTMLNKLLAFNTGDWETRILRVDPSVDMQLLYAMGKTPKLNCILGAHARHFLLWSGYFPHLTFTHIHRLKPQFLHQPLVSSTLTTLRLMQFSATGVSFVGWQLPLLRHFSFSGSSQMTIGSFRSMLACIGQNLISCMDCSPLTEDLLPLDTWDLCPRLEHLQTSFIWDSLPQRLRTLRVAYLYFRDGGSEKRIPREPSYAHLEQVGTDSSWSEMWSEGRRGSNRLWDCYWLCLQYNVLFRDINGLRFQEFIFSPASYSSAPPTPVPPAYRLDF